MNAWCVKLTFESLFGAGTTTRVQMSGCKLARRFVETAEDAVLAPVKPLMLQALMKLFRQCIESEYFHADSSVSTNGVGRGRAESDAATDIYFELCTSCACLSSPRALRL